MSPWTKDDLKIIREHAVGEYPHECCGIVLGKIGSADENILYRCENIQNRLHEKDPETFTRDARTAFYIDPKDKNYTIYTIDPCSSAIKVVRTMCDDNSNVKIHQTTSTEFLKDFDDKIDLL